MGESWSTFARSKVVLFEVHVYTVVSVSFPFWMIPFLACIGTFGDALDLDFDDPLFLCLLLVETIEDLELDTLLTDLTEVLDLLPVPLRLFALALCFPPPTLLEAGCSQPYISK